MSLLFVAMFFPFPRESSPLENEAFAREWIMAEEYSIIHEHAQFFDEILDCIPAALYLQPTEEDDHRWKKYYKVDDVTLGIIP